MSPSDEKRNMGCACSGLSLPLQPPRKVEPVCTRRSEDAYTDTFSDDIEDTTQDDIEDDIEVARERRTKSKSLQILGIE